MRFIIPILLVGAISLRAEPPASGRWEGSAKIPGEDLTLIVDLSQPEPAKWNGSISIPSLHLKSAFLDAISVDGSKVSFVIKTALADPHLGQAKFTGTLAGDVTLSGNFIQAGNTAPFSLTKIGPAQVELPSRSTNIAKELEGEWKGTYEMLGYSRTVTLKLQNQASAGATADFLIVGKRENHLPVDLVVQNGDFVTVDSHETGLSFEGRLVKGELNGTILQGPFEASIRLRRENGGAR